MPLTGHGQALPPRRRKPPARAAGRRPLRGPALARRPLLAGACSAALVILIGCTPAPPKPDGPAPAAAAAPSRQLDHDPGDDPAFARYYEQDPAWSRCGAVFECARIDVPLDWDDPAGPPLDLGVVRLPATDPRAAGGALLLNPGGPGISGIDYLVGSAAPIVSAAVRGQYDLVAFDPRGVGVSDPIDCLTDKDLDAFLAHDTDPQTDQGLHDLKQAAQRFAEGCADRTGKRLAHIGTASAARDMDVLRAVLGQDKLNYLGKSYGTLLGATYADLFPHRVGRVVLDGAIDPTLDYTGIVHGQAGGLEQALRAYADACPIRPNCPVPGDTEDILHAVRTLLTQIEQEPLTTDRHRPLTAPLAVNGLIAPLYEHTAWPVLDTALAAALHGDGTGLLKLADLYAGRQPAGGYETNAVEAFHAISCLDYPADATPQALHAAQTALLETSPTFGSALAYGEVLCAAWPVLPARIPAPLKAQGADPVLVVGTTGDPATPYAWARALADQLTSGRLLTWHGQGHTAYLRGSVCVDATIDAYLLNGVVPEPETTCQE